jgi:hypothetical protein
MSSQTPAKRKPNFVKLGPNKKQNCSTSVNQNGEEVKKSEVQVSINDLNAHQ